MGVNTFETLRLAHSSTVDRVVEELRRALFDGEVEAGTPLREMALAEAMGVSRSTVREALAILVGEGLATREPNRGVHVTELDPVAVHDVCTARGVLEVAGIRRWPQASQDAREACRTALREFATVATGTPSPAELTAAHLAIHRSFVGLTGVDAPGRPGRVADRRDPAGAGQGGPDPSQRRRADALPEVLLDLLEDGEVDAAAAELGRHLEDAETSMLTALDLA